MNEQVIIILRYVLIAGGAFAIGRGWATEEQVEVFTGGAITIATVLWGMYVRWNTKSVPIVTADRRDVPTINPVTGNTIPGDSKG